MISARGKSSCFVSALYAQNLYLNLNLNLCTISYIVARMKQ